MRKLNNLLLETIILWSIVGSKMPQVIIRKASIIKQTDEVKNFSTGIFKNTDLAKPSAAV
jgi:hypothetical protein